MTMWLPCPCELTQILWPTNSSNSTRRFPYLSLHCRLPASRQSRQRGVLISFWWFFPKQRLQTSIVVNHLLLLWYPPELLISCKQSWCCAAEGAPTTTMEFNAALWRWLGGRRRPLLLNESGSTFSFPIIDRGSQLLALGMGWRNGSSLKYFPASVSP